MKKKILVIEDQLDMLMGLKDNLEFEGYEVITAVNGLNGLEIARTEKPDLIILDIMLPKMDGFDMCRELRAGGPPAPRTSRQAGLDIPIIMLTAKGQEIDKVLGLELGADDYITKPFSLRELLARIKAVLRRTSPRDREIRFYEFGDVKLDFDKYEATKRSQKLELLPREFAVLKYLIQRGGEMVTRDELYDAVWGDKYYPDARPVDNQIARIRKKIEDDPKNPKHIITVHKVGYKFIG